MHLEIKDFVNWKISLKNIVYFFPDISKLCIVKKPVKHIFKNILQLTWYVLSLSASCIYGTMSTLKC